MTAAGKGMLQGERADGSLVFAAVDASARYCSASVADMRFGALLTPFPTEEAAERALSAAGATIVVRVDQGRRGR